VVGRAGRRAVVAGIAVAVIALTLYAVVQYELPHGEPPTPNVAGAGKALIADSLGIDFPNSKLLSRVTSILKDAGFKVDVVMGRDVNMSLYERLTNYQVVLLRIHGGKASYVTASGEVKIINGLFTGVPWSDEFEELKKEWLGTRARPYHNPNEAYLALLPKFFLEKLSGYFPPNSTVVVASCYSLITPDIAKSMGAHGLRYFVGWEGPVTVEHMDKAVVKLFEYRFEEGLSWPEAVEEVNNELGPDPLKNEYLRIVSFK